jgi:hypothetical protein
MTAAELVKDLRAAGVILRPGSNALEIDAPAGLVTDELRAALLRWKPAILDQLHAEAAVQRKERAQKCLCAGCHRFALSRPGLLCFWCRQRAQHDPAGAEQ